MPRKTKGFRIVTGVVAMFVAGCRPSDPADGTARGEDRGSVATAGTLGEHWVQNERLRDVMAQISQQAAKWPAGVPDDPEAAESREARAEAEQAFRDAAALADGLAAAARMIPRSVADHPMSGEDRRGFTAEAKRLRDQALQLRVAARERKVEGMQRALDGISSSCISCHSQYRDFTGELGDRKASAD